MASTRMDRPSQITLSSAENIGLTFQMQDPYYDANLPAVLQNEGQVSSTDVLRFHRCAPEEGWQLSQLCHLHTPCLSVVESTRRATDLRELKGRGQSTEK